MSTSRERDIVTAFLALSNPLVDDDDVVELVSGLAVDCARLLDVAAVGLLLADAVGSLQVSAATSERTHALELFQLQRDEGPSRDCYHHGESVVVADLAESTDRYPHFAPTAISLGFASVHSLPLHLRGRVLGTLDLFGSSVGALDQDDRDLAEALAHVASTALGHETVAHDTLALDSPLHGALSSRVLLEQAKGVIAQTGTIDVDLAFVALRRYARDHGLRLAATAQSVVTLELDPGDLIAYARSVAVITTP